MQLLFWCKRIRLGKTYARANVLYLFRREGKFDNPTHTGPLSQQIKLTLHGWHQNIQPHHDGYLFFRWNLWRYGHVNNSKNDNQRPYEIAVAGQPDFIDRSACSKAPSTPLACLLASHRPRLQVISTLCWAQISFYNVSKNAEMVAKRSLLISDVEEAGTFFDQEQCRAQQHDISGQRSWRYKYISCIANF